MRGEYGPQCGSTYERVPLTNLSRAPGTEALWALYAMLEFLLYDKLAGRSEDAESTIIARRLNHYFGACVGEGSATLVGGFLGW